MQNSVPSISRSMKFGAVMASAAAALLIAGAMITIAPQQASATPAAAEKTKLACGQCHVNPAGGGKLKPRGEQFKASGK